MPSSLTRVLPSVSGFSPRPPVSVSGTGTSGLVSGFSRQREIMRFSTQFRSPSRLSLRRAFFTTRQPRRLDAVDHHRARTILLCHRFTHATLGGAGISTCSPSPTAFALGLGPDLPWVDEPSPGNLGPSTPAFLAQVSLLIPAFSLLHAPQVLSILLLRMHDAPLPTTAFTIPPHHQGRYGIGPYTPPGHVYAGRRSPGCPRGIAPRNQFVSRGFAARAGRLRDSAIFPHARGVTQGGWNPPCARHCKCRRSAASVSRLSPGHLRR